MHSTITLAIADGHRLDLLAQAERARLVRTARSTSSSRRRLTARGMGPSRPILSSWFAMVIRGRGGPAPAT
ncbi:MAG: hypothetical protein QOC66_550 [Pseudonocardiales bacterium]|jgi:hypothetical protein|nr:hypothetical protein [Pseudonocardiales bacterium]